MIGQQIGQGLEGPLEIFFRPTGIFGRCRLVVESEGKQIAAFPRQRMAPGEMEKIRLAPALLAQVQGSLQLRVEEEAE